MTTNICTCTDESKTYHYQKKIRCTQSREEDERGTKHWWEESRGKHKQISDHSYIHTHTSDIQYIHVCQNSHSPLEHCERARVYSMNPIEDSQPAKPGSCNEGGFPPGSVSIAQGRALLQQIPGGHVLQQELDDDN